MKYMMGLILLLGGSAGIVIHSYLNNSRSVSNQDLSANVDIREDFLEVNDVQPAHVADVMHKNELRDEVEKVYGEGLQEMRTGVESGLKQIKSETDPALLVDKKIDAVIQHFDLKLSQTQQRIQKAIEKHQQRMDAIDSRVKNIEQQQKQVLDRTNKIKKMYVEEKVRREIADQVIKQQLITD